eukprot:2338608-Alexandrium_andersonii.AAC.1
MADNRGFAGVGGGGFPPGGAPCGGGNGGEERGGGGERRRASSRSRSRQKHELRCKIMEAQFAKNELLRKELQQAQGRAEAAKLAKAGYINLWRKVVAERGELQQQ